MKNPRTVITQSFISTFTLERVTIDVFEYLNENCNNWFRKEDKYFLLEAYNLDTEKSEPIRLSIEDKITIISYFTELKFTHDMDFYVVIGLGNFIESKISASFFKVDKCLAKLRYNSDLSLFDVEFYLTQINKQ